MQIQFISFVSRISNLSVLFPGFCSQACPLNPNPLSLSGQQELLQDFSKRFSPAIRGVVEFAKRVPGFTHLLQEDQVTLLKAGVFEVLLVRLACLFVSEVNIFYLKKIIILNFNIQSINSC